jgi:hypothetical protein
MKNRTAAILVSALFFTSSSNLSDTEYIVIGWNDLGMHCANKNFQTFAVLPPYNNMHAQVIRRGDASTSPALVTESMGVAYEIPGNTYSVGKTNFWDYEDKLFGVSLPDNIGLKGSGLTGSMTAMDGYFGVEGIPVTPYTDADLVNEDAYQLARLTLTDASLTVRATTNSVIPVSNEINCVSAGCHAEEQAILNAHDAEGGFDPNAKPILCAKCHSSNALGTAGTPGVPPLSQVVHGKHAEKTNDCYKCHPGTHTRCLRDIMFSKGLVCQTCHGTVLDVATSIENGRRPWLDEPSCGACHGQAFSEESGKLFRQSRGHGGLFCSACHGSPHAILPTIVERDNVQNIALQGYSGTLRKCVVCHGVNPQAAGPHGIMATGIEPAASDRPDRYELLQNYPNPFNPSTTLVFRMKAPGKVRLSVYDSLGRSIALLVNAQLPEGEYRIPFRMDNLSAGVYFYRLSANGFSETKKMAVVD